MDVCIRDYGRGGGVLAAIGAVIASVRGHAPLWSIFLVPIFFSPIITLGILWSGLKIVVTEDTLTHKLPGQADIIFNFKDIYKIVRSMTKSGFQYYVCYHDKKGKNKHIILDSNLIGLDELVHYVQSKSGIKARLQGGFNIDAEQRPTIRILKIIWNIFIVAVIILVISAYPFKYASNRYKENSQGLRVHSLWP